MGMWVCTNGKGISYLLVNAFYIEPRLNGV